MRVAVEVFPEEQLSSLPIVAGAHQRDEMALLADPDEICIPILVQHAEGFLVKPGGPGKAPFMMKRQPTGDQVLPGPAPVPQPHGEQIRSGEQLAGPGQLALRDAESGLLAGQMSEQAQVARPFTQQGTGLPEGRSRRLVPLVDPEGIGQLGPDLRLEVADHGPGVILGPQALGRPQGTIRQAFHGPGIREPEREAVVEEGLYQLPALEGRNRLQPGCIGDFRGRAQSLENAGELLVFRALGFPLASGGRSTRCKGAPLEEADDAAASGAARQEMTNHPSLIDGVKTGGEELCKLLLGGMVGHPSPPRFLDPLSRRAEPSSKRRKYLDYSSIPMPRA
jgi:hypothetical protein